MDYLLITHSNYLKAIPCFSNYDLPFAINTLGSCHELKMPLLCLVSILLHFFTGIKRELLLTNLPLNYLWSFERHFMLAGPLRSGDINETYPGRESQKFNDAKIFPTCGANSYLRKLTLQKSPTAISNSGHV